MTVAMPVIRAKIDAIDGSVFAATSLAGAMLVAILLRYPSYPGHEKPALIGLALIALCAILALLLGSRRPFAGEGKSLGAWIGALTGFFWLVEISFNNFVDPRISTERARFYVDNGFWAAIALTILAAAIAISASTGRMIAGVRAGLWSGCISGVISCLMGLSLVLFWMRFLLRDPINIREFAARGNGASAATMASYFAYETLAGSLGHLFVLGAMMGLLLGLTGGLIGALVARLGRPDPPGA
jgi:hypothetical protein